MDYESFTIWLRLFSIPLDISIQLYCTIRKHTVSEYSPWIHCSADYEFFDISLLRLRLQSAFQNMSRKLMGSTMLMPSFGLETLTLLLKLLVNMKEGSLLIIKLT